MQFKIAATLKKDLEITPKNCGACGLFIDKSEEDLNGYHRDDLCDANDEIGDK